MTHVGTLISGMFTKVLSLHTEAWETAHTIEFV